MNDRAGEGRQSGGHSTWFLVVVALFIATLIASNIVAVKLIDVSGLILTAAIVIFPLSYIIGDVLTEVYGYRQARRVIWLGFLANLVVVVAIALGEAGDRDELRHLSPRMRNAIYQLLFKMVSFRTVEPRIPPKKVLRTKLTKLIRRVAGAEMIESLIIHVAKVTEIQ